MMKFKTLVDHIYLHQKFILVGHYFKSEPVSKMDDKQKVKELVMGWGEDYVHKIHCINGCIQIELKTRH